MQFNEKYISAAEKALDTKSTKIVINDDAFAIGEAIQGLIDKIEHLRIALK